MTYKIAVYLAVFLTLSLPNAVLAAGSHPCDRLKTSEVRKFKLQEGKTLPFVINKRLSRFRGNAWRGRAVFVDPDRGNCIACHAVKSIQNRVKADNFGTIQAYGNPGTLGAALDGIGSRYTPGELRVILVDPKIAFPTKDITMPAYYKVEGLVDIEESCVGKTILSAREIEDLVTYLSTLKKK